MSGSMIDFAVNNSSWLVPLVVSLVISLISAFVGQRQFNKKMQHENDLAVQNRLLEVKKIETANNYQQTRENHEFISRLTFENLTEFLEIVPMAVRETQFYLADDVIRYMAQHQEEANEMLWDKVVESELFKEIKREGDHFSINTAKAQNLLIYASDENRKKFSDALQKLSITSFYITSLFITGEFDKLREYIRPFPSPAGLIQLEAATLEGVESIRNELNLLINKYRE